MSPAPCGKGAVFHPFSCTSLSSFLALFALIIVFWTYAASAQAQHRGRGAAPVQSRAAMPVHRATRPRIVRIRPVQPHANRAIRANRAHRRGFAPNRLHPGRHFRPVGKRRFRGHRVPSVWANAPVSAPAIIEAPHEVAVDDQHGAQDYRPYHRYARRHRCVAPKIIQIGPIDPNYGPGPRLIYGSRNRCGEPEFVNLYKPRRHKALHRKY